MGWLSLYVARTPGIELSDNGTVLLDVDSEVQPDGFLFREPPPDPRAAHLTDADYVEGAPQLVVDVAASTAARDLRSKMEAYRRAGVQEYLVWRTEDKLLDWFRLQPDGTYQRVSPDAQGVVESSQFPGLRLKVAKLLAEDLAGVLAGLDTPHG
jgi:Uma2 family endonuclease